MSQNWVKENTKSCPKCTIKLYKDGLQTNRVSCTGCDYNNFCWTCGKSWKGSGSHCGNE